MIIFCNTDGKIYHVIPDKVYQGSAGANTIYFVGQFPSSSQVTMAYTLPNGISLPPKLLTPVKQLDKVDIPDGAYSVWMIDVGTRPKTENGEIVKDSQGNTVYEPDYTITENYGETTIQFYVYGGGATLATESVMFTIEKGVPAEYPLSLQEGGDAQTILAQILDALTNTIPQTEKGEANGVAPLDKDGRIDKSYLPTDIGTGGSGGSGSGVTEDEVKAVVKAVVGVEVMPTVNNALEVAETAANAATQANEAAESAKEAAEAAEGKANAYTNEQVDLINTTLSESVIPSVTAAADIANEAKTSAAQAATDAAQVNAEIGKVKYTLNGCATKKELSNEVEKLTARIDTLDTGSTEGGFTVDQIKEYAGQAAVTKAGEVVAELNIENGSGSGAIQQEADGVAEGFSFVDKNTIASDNFKNYKTNLNETDRNYINKHIPGDDLETTIPYGAIGNFSFSKGGKSAAFGKRSSAEGTTTLAFGKYSHVEGDNSVTFGDDSHAEGYETVTGAAAQASHAEGIRTQALGWAAHSEGSDTIAEGNNSHAGGSYTIAKHNDQTVIGTYNDNKYGTLFEVGNGADSNNRSNAFEVYRNGLVVVGNRVQQIPDGVAEGFSFKDKNPNAADLDTQVDQWNKGNGDVQYGARGNFSSSFGGKSAAIGKRSHAEGTTTIAKGNYSHAEGDNSVTLGADSHAEGYQTTTAPSANASHAEGYGTVAGGTASHAEGQYTNAKGNASHAGGSYSEASGFASRAIGAHTVSSGQYSHAEGYRTQSDGDNSHSEGANTQALGDSSHSEGGDTTAEGDYSHAEGNNTHAYGKSSHTEGGGTVTSGEFSHAEGFYTIAGYDHQHVSGRYNDNKEDTLFEVGNGSPDKPSNAFEVCKNGTAYAGGKRVLTEADYEEWTFTVIQNGITTTITKKVCAHATNTEV